MNPLTRKRLRDFRQSRRAWGSLWLLCALYIVSLGAELLCNNRPLWLRHEGRIYLPLLRFYPEDRFLGNDRMTRPDYKALREDPRFTGHPGNRMLLPPIPFGPNEVVRAASLEPYRTVTVTLRPDHAVGRLNLTPDGDMVRPLGLKPFLPDTADPDDPGKLSGYWTLPDALRQGIAARFRNEAAPAVSAPVRCAVNPDQTLYMRLPGFEPRRDPPETVRVSLRETLGDAIQPATVILDRSGRARPRRVWRRLPDALQGLSRSVADQAFDRSLVETQSTWDNRRVAIVAARNEVSFPHRPVPGHWMGIDASGRDVLTLMLYGLRIAMSFGLLLVVTATLIGTLLGATQGFFGGWTDILGQRFIEIWAAPPFLYIMILAGAVLGRGFLLFLVCYGLFNWIGISAYMRAEFLRLRGRPFVDAARCQGSGSLRIMIRHILPNALTPLITLFPFQLVGAVSALTALDYLGFGLPPMTPSWGQLLAQAQQYRWAWWLILYPSLGLFTVMLLTVFIGEGLRNAFDPKPFTKLQ